MQLVIIGVEGFLIPWLLSELSQLQPLRFRGTRSLQKVTDSGASSPVKVRRREIHNSTVLQLLTRNYSILLVCYKTELKHMDFAETGLKKDYGGAVSRQGIEYLWSTSFTWSVTVTEKIVKRHSISGRAFHGLSLAGCPGVFLRGGHRLRFIRLQQRSSGTAKGKHPRAPRPCSSAPERNVWEG